MSTKSKIVMPAGPRAERNKKLWSDYHLLSKCCPDMGLLDKCEILARYYEMGAKGIYRIIKAGDRLPYEKIKKNENETERDNKEG